MPKPDFTPKLLSRLDKERGIVNLYKARTADGSRKYLTKRIAAVHGVDPSTVYRIAKRWGIAQSHAEANRSIVSLKSKHRIRRLAPPPTPQ